MNHLFDAAPYYKNLNKPHQFTGNESRRRPQEPEDWKSFAIGDIVSRGGIDEHIIFDINDAGDLIGVRCIKEPAAYDSQSEPWTKIGEEEHNCAWRYDLVMKHIDIQISEKETG